MSTNPKQAYTERREQLAALDHEHCDCLSGVDAAILLSVSTPVICEDRQSEEYKAARGALSTRREKRVDSLAWALVEGVIQDGINAREKPPDISFLSENGGRATGAAIAAVVTGHEGRIERGNRTAQWWLEKRRKFEGDTTSTDNAATSLLAAILHGADPEKEAMRRELAEIKARLSKLNGIGADVLQGLDNTDTGETE